MALFYGAGTRQHDSGKFQPRRRLGMQQGSKHQYGGYQLELITMESTAPIARVRYHVGIFDKRRLRVGFLRDFSSAQQAIHAAQEWVAERELTVRKNA